MSTGLVAPARILVISPNWIGDAVMAQPLLQLLKAQQPASPIDVMAPHAVAPVWRAMAEVDTVLETPFRHGALQWRERRAFAAQLRARGYGSAYVLPNTLKFALIPWLARIPRRVGYLGEMRYVLLNVLHHDAKDAPRPMVSFYAALANPPGASVATPAQLPRPRLRADASTRADVLGKYGLAGSGPLIAFAPGAEFGSAKRWPAERFGELADLILARYLDARIILLGSPKDRPVCEEVAGGRAGIHNLAGKTSLAEAIALIASAGAMVSNDSGLLHIASALNRPVVALYGPTDPLHAPPFSDLAQSLYLHLECAPCKQRECPLGHHACMQGIAAEMAWQPLQPMLALPARASA